MNLDACDLKERRWSSAADDNPSDVVMREDVPLSLTKKVRTLFREARAFMEIGEQSNAESTLDRCRVFLDEEETLLTTETKSQASSSSSAEEAGAKEDQ